MSTNIYHLNYYNLIKATMFFLLVGNLARSLTKTPSAIIELILLGTRTIFGVSINKVLNYLNQQQKNVFLNQLEELKKKNFIRLNKDRFFVDDNTRFISDHIARELIILS